MWGEEACFDGRWIAIAMLGWMFVGGTIAIIVLAAKGWLK